MTRDTPDDRESKGIHALVSLSLRGAKDSVELQKSRHRSPFHGCWYIRRKEDLQMCPSICKR